VSVSVRVRVRLEGECECEGEGESDLVRNSGHVLDGAGNALLGARDRHHARVLEGVN